MMVRLLFLSFLFIFSNIFASNPFAIDYQTKIEISNDDYLEIQKKLRAIDIGPLLSQLYVGQDLASFNEFFARSSRGIRAVLIDPEKGHFPITELKKINRGGSCCVVSCAPYDGVRSVLLQKIPPALEATGFNGYFYYRIGGFPNPTGNEIRYAGVPYCFKIFMMLEAEKLGFSNVLWIDSACLPLKNPAPLFKWLDSSGICYMEKDSDNPISNKKYLLPETHQLFKTVLNVDLFKQKKMWSPVFGLKMNSHQVKRFISEYYHLVELGTPFISVFPEEFVFTALLAKMPYSRWEPVPVVNMLKWTNQSEDTPERIEQAKNEGYFFYQLRH